jgi:mevalonate pyrophosphate decarboxylase
VAISVSPHRTLVEEYNAMSRHTVTASAWPTLLYWQPDALTQMKNVWQLRTQELALYLTMDARPNLKLLFEAKHQADVESAFEQVNVITPCRQVGSSQLGRLGGLLRE